jgi:exodeoxyribonuclease VII large subunit
MMIKNASRRLDHLSVRISGGTTNLLHLRHNSLVRMQEILRHSSIQVMYKSENRLNELQLRFRTSPLRITDRASLTLDKLEAQFRLLDPKNILKRGYALISRDQNIIRSVDQISLDETIKVTLADGTLQTVITTITKNDNE